VDEKEGETEAMKGPKKAASSGSMNRSNSELPSQAGSVTVTTNQGIRLDRALRIFPPCDNLDGQFRELFSSGLV